jgi:hypothetical protein
MDARIKSGHDGWVSRSERRERFAQTPTSFSNGRIVIASQRFAMTMLQFQIHLRASRRDAPELCIYLPPPRRAWGMPGARCTRSPVCSVESTRVVATGTPESPGIPARNGFNSLCRALPGDRALLPPSPADIVLSKPGWADLNSANLTPASGRQDHTILPSAASISRPRTW